jgi:hypothetical protein
MVTFAFSWYFLPSRGSLKFNKFYSLKVSRSGTRTKKYGNHCYLCGNIVCGWTSCVHCGLAPGVKSFTLLYSLVPVVAKVYYNTVNVVSWRKILHPKLHAQFHNIWKTLGKYNGHRQNYYGNLWNLDNKMVSAKIVQLYFTFTCRW